MAIDKNLIQRTLAGIVFLAVMIFCIVYNSITVSILFTAISMVASYELVQMVSLKTGAAKYRYVTVFLLAAMSVIFILTLNGHYIGRWWKYIPLFFFLSFVLLFLLPNTIEGRLVQSVTFLFGSFYTVLSFLLFSGLVSENSYNGTYSYFNLLFLFALVWTNDTMAYVCGRLWGKHKMSPELSPKKTTEGLIGGMLFTLAVSLIVCNAAGFRFTHPVVWLAPLAVSVFATMGDLFESAIKRWAGVKDSGSLIPGHGGVLDRFDGALFAVWPYAYIVQMYV